YGQRHLRESDELPGQSRRTVQRIFDRAEAFEGKRHQESAKHCTGNRRGATNDQHSEDDECLPQIKGGRLERGDEMGPEATGQTCHEGAENKAFPAEEGEVCPHGAGCDLIIPYGPQKETRAGFFEEQGSKSGENGSACRHENGGAKLVHGSGWIVLLRAV